MEYTLKDKEGNVKHYEVSYSQILQRRTNKLITVLIVLLLALIVGLAFTLYQIDVMNIPTKIIYGG